MIKNNIKYLAVLALGLVACEPEFDNPIDETTSFTSGEADFSKYVALGNSLTAGFADNALYISGQENSYPNILAKRLAFAGGGEFTQPLMSDDIGGFSNDPLRFPPRLVLEFDENGENPSPGVYAGGVPTTDFTSNLGSSFNNMGVPGARVYHLGFPGYGTANPYFGRFASAANATVIGDALAQNPTFFSLWIGNNDILGYATSGGVGEDHNVTGNTDPSTYSVAGLDITNNNTFAGTYSQLITGLVGSGAKGVVLNLPNVTSLPFFTTVPFAPLSPLSPTFGPQIPTLNATYAGLNQAFAFIGVPERSITFSETAASAVVIKDESLTDISAALTQALTPTFGAGLAGILGAQFGQARQATANDLLVLTSSGIIGELDEDRAAQLVGLGVPQEQAGQFSINGVTLPLDDQYVLIPDEQAAIETARVAYNTTIQGLATANGLAFVDIAAALSQAANGGIPFNGGVVTSAFASGGGFSLDGVHPTPRAHALVANSIMDALEETYGAQLPRVDIGDFGTITLSNDVIQPPSN
ncbi:G-D-S-L family lipolytic protein [Aquimarina sp. MMG016]|uniref:G-D-S-L family lipolytic protein n=1 Tax=Aquimarina sp. MMG016 TaxID=2822690 RepID=UPI001B39D071|nr:G-D-S-L family lipolytic protein [Aquimarina sp. MMG016]MBQ4818643.1 G-D-S-L family lipolytic protein [Aquimarina sp. MMG016]